MTETNRSQQLPDKPSALIRLALDDLRKVERDARYAVDMGYWHTGTWEPEHNNTCMVCLAGAVMAGTLGADPTQVRYPDCYSLETEARLESLDCFRVGNVRNGLYRFHQRTETADAYEGIGIELAGAVPEYYVSGEDNTGWYAGMEKLADDLQARGY